MVSETFSAGSMTPLRIASPAFLLTYARAASVGKGGDAGFSYAREQVAWSSKRTVSAVSFTESVASFRASADTEKAARCCETNAARRLKARLLDRRACMVDVCVFEQAE